MCGYCCCIEEELMDIEEEKYFRVNEVLRCFFFLMFVNFFLV